MEILAFIFLLIGIFSGNKKWKVAAGACFGAAIFYYFMAFVVLKWFLPFLNAM